MNETCSNCKRYVEGKRSKARTVQDRPVCMNCGSPKIRCEGLCAACHEYKKRTGQERPKRLIERSKARTGQDRPVCTNCGSPKIKCEGLCAACHQLGRSVECQLFVAHHINNLIDYAARKRDGVPE